MGKLDNKRLLTLELAISGSKAKIVSVNNNCQAVTLLLHT